MPSLRDDIERTFALCQRALELMRSHGSPASPRAYEVWYTYVSGHKPLMNDAIKRILAEGRPVADAEINAIYEQHLSPYHSALETERTSVGMLTEIDAVLDMVGLAIGTTAKYGQSLESLSNDLAGPVDRAKVREVIGSLVHATREAASTNRSLDARLKETRDEIETLREALESVRAEALTDPLTGIANRKHFEDMLIKGVQQAEESRAPLALVLIDIDEFKRFNDTYGHLTGDQVLRLVGMTMRDHVKTTATLARFGGEEFAIIMPGATLAEARAAAEQIRQSVMARELIKRSTGESLGKVTISLGVATYRPGDTGSTLLERADQCMYAAKRGGRNRTVTSAEHQTPGDLPEVA
ncbi:MAG TPA: GGDEF domain-containing protein [Beijerinckiaceae bacterium]|nr:GGDEF domain-containing protein [Beijerinckiaceae bacterium]